MLPDRVSNPGPLTYESGALPIALRGPALYICDRHGILAQENCFLFCIFVTDMVYWLKKTAFFFVYL